MTLSDTKLHRLGARPRRARRSLARQRATMATLMSLPLLALLGVFVFYPLLNGAWISLHQWDGISSWMEWFGARNYVNSWNDPIFRRALLNTFVFALGVTVAKNVLALVIAVALNRALKWQGLFRTATFLPVVMSYVAVGLLWSWIFNPTFGLLNTLLRSLGLESLILGWLSDPGVAMASIMTVDVWKWTGFHVVILLAGLHSVPQELHEAAALDGANGFQTFMHVTLPQLMPVLTFSVLMSISGAFVSNYDLVTVMTGGGPGNSTEVALTWIIHTALVNNNVGRANAMSMILFVIVAIVGAIQVRAMMSRNES